MEDLPNQLVGEILGRVISSADRNSLSLTCKHFYELDNEYRQSICVGCGLNPANEGLSSLCVRFPNLRKVEIVYSGWMSKLGKQLDDRGLLMLANNCSFLTELSLCYCTFITDLGLGYLTSSSSLSSFKLKFTPRVTGCGIFSLVVGCKKLTHLHLIRCLNISGSEWLECLGRLGTLEELLIKNCRAIGEGDLINLGESWRKLKRLQFEVDTNYRYMKVNDRISVEKWKVQPFPCESMVELRLVNCIISSGRGLACVLGKCKNLENVHLDTCIGLTDSDIIGLAQSSRQLRSISLRLASDFSLPLLMNPLRLTDESLKALSANCSLLESVRIAFSDEEFPSLCSFSLDGILTLLRMCPIRELSLDQVLSFNDVGMEALCSIFSLENLELVRCQEISDDGVSLVSQFPRLRVLRLVKCLGVTDSGLQPLMGLHKLDLLAVEGCPRVSERGVIGTARSVSFKQDLSWMH